MVMTIELPTVRLPKLTISPAVVDELLRVRFSGSADLDAEAALERYLPRVHGEALRLALPELIVDFTLLEFMSSGCFRHFVTWLGDVQELPAERQYRLRILSNEGLLWQRRSLKALKTFADALVKIET